ncbi:MAG: aminotransferase class I/II-fold pyridoxal phosphate-dependent enzyme [Nitriliruptor sp.]|nr:MAG: aminotransferase class I/II-fold pyridoxal phosphate-dependent enzyme [Nitriliruptor sp.]
MGRRILLSPPDVGPRERDRLLAAFDSGWIAPVGPDLDAFEVELAAATGRGHAVALSSGTAALHLALHVLGVGPGDDVLVPTLTFAATANAVTYVGARPVFLDVEVDDWTLDPELVADHLAARARDGERLPAAIIPVDLYGHCADYSRLAEIAGRYDVPVVSDAAEALGAARSGRPAGSFGVMAACSFNGNKTITTSGGGALVTDDGELAAHVRKLATQAREPVLHYEHREVGFNYRLSNLLAALGRGQLEGLDAKVARRRELNVAYRAALADLPGVTFPTAAPDSDPSWWLTCLTVDPEVAGADRDELIAALDAADVEARPVWKPMHLQPVFSGLPAVGGEVAAAAFAHGVCLPSGSSLTAAEQDRVITCLRDRLA